MLGAAGDGVGAALAGGSDLDGDGRPDVIVGTPASGIAGGRARAGGVDVVSGFGLPSLSYPQPLGWATGRAIAPLAPAFTHTGPFAFTVAPPLPAGLVLDPASGRIAGTPLVPERGVVHVVSLTDLTASISFDLTVTVADRTAPHVRLRPLLRGLAAVLRARRLPLALRCDEPASVALTVRAPRLPVRGALQGAPVVIARGVVRCAAGRPSLGRLALTARGRAAMALRARRRSVTGTRLSFSLRASDAARNVRVELLHATLSR
jgi:hypothetical protein